MNAAAQQRQLKALARKHIKKGDEKLSHKLSPKRYSQQDVAKAKSVLHNLLDSIADTRVVSVTYIPEQDNEL